MRAKLSTILGAALSVGCVASIKIDVIDPKTFFSPLKPCPAACGSHNPSDWTVYSSVKRLEVCEEPMLLDFNIFTSLEDAAKIRACTVGNINDESNGLLQEDEHSQQVHHRSVEARSKSSCGVFKQSSQTIDVTASSDSGSAEAKDLLTALEKVESHFQDKADCSTEFVVGYHKGAVVAFYGGAAIQQSKTIPGAFSQIKNLLSGKSPKTLTAQLCGDDRSADYNFGLAIDTTGDLIAVQKAIQPWAHGKCVTGSHPTNQLENIAVYELPLLAESNHGKNNQSEAQHKAVRDIMARGDCKTQTVVSGDSCGSLASKCGISASDFTKYNSDPDLCSTLSVGQRVCCSAGTLPDIRPKQNANGTCATYTVQSQDYCTMIANANGLKVDDLNKFNNGKTWGWNGCDRLFAGINMCLSDGDPPLPAPVANSLCGPTVPGTKYPTDGTKIADLNPCPLNSCCDIWGQCGVTPEYCTAESGPTNNPGTAPPNKNGCVSNCGTDIKNNDDPPEKWISVGYYESWNWDRPCLNYRAVEIPGSGVTHAHWAFGIITSNFGVLINDTSHQLNDFLSLSLHKVISFGGWGYSTDPATYDLLRQAMNPENVDTFTDNIVNLLNSKGFDGVDIDWEYPGAPDIPGIPPGLKTDGPNYLAFLQKLRSKLPDGKTMSIAAPASYWYLRAFPIDKMAKELDYIVYMTYDLHGQWDYANQWSQDGCTSGDCIRSHVNLTETGYTLAMITKAGVPANKVTVGVSSYGRAFGVTDVAACKKDLSDPNCKMVGPDSAAQAGECTQTAGYISNAEINEIIDLGDNVYSYYDSGSDSDMAFYGKSSWVAYMTPTTKGSRKAFYKGMNFAGTIDWALDLQEFGDYDQDPDGSGDDDELPDTSPLAPCDGDYKTLDDLDAAAGDIPDHCITIYTMIALRGLLTETLNNYTDMVNHGYDDKFDIYASAVADSAGDTVYDFITKNGNKYFSCIVAEVTVCCDKCGDTGGNACEYCFDGKCYKTCGQTGCSDSKRDLAAIDATPWSVSDSGLIGRGDGGPNTPVPNTQTKNVSEPCPPDYSKRGGGGSSDSSLWWTLDHGDDFYADLETNTGVPKSKTTIGDRDRGNDCAPSNKRGDGDDCWNIGYDYGIVIPSGYTKDDVVNPKDVVKKGLARALQLGPEMDRIIDLLKMDGWLGDGGELIDSIAMPIFMLASATENMAQVVKIADKITEERRKALILAFLAAIFLIIPVIGEVIGSVAELADIAVVLDLVGTAGNVATDIYTIVSDPKNAPLAIFDLVLAPLALTDVAAITKASSWRRGMSDDDVAKLGDGIAKRAQSVEKIKGKCIPDLVP